MKKHSLFLAVVLPTAICDVAAHDNSQRERIKSSLCTRENALTIIQQQIDFTKTFASYASFVTPGFTPGTLFVK